MKRYTVIAAICVLLACSPVQANDVSSYINDNLGQFFPDMHSQLPLERSPPPPICSPISGVMTFTTKALRILTFDNRGSDDRLQVEASSDSLSRLITISSAQCRIQFRIFRAEKSSEGEKPLTPFDGSGIPGAEKKQVSSSGSIIEAAAYFPDATKTCGEFSIPFVDDRVGIRFLASGNATTRVGLSDFPGTPGRRLNIPSPDCKISVFVDLFMKQGDNWVEDSQKTGEASR